MKFSWLTLKNQAGVFLWVLAISGNYLAPWFKTSLCFAQTDRKYIVTYLFHMKIVGLCILAMCTIFFFLMYQISPSSRLRINIREKNPMLIV